MYKYLMTFSLLLLLLAGCSESSLVDKTLETRDKFSDRVNGNDTKDIEVSDNYWYTWNNHSKGTSVQAPDGTELIEGKVNYVVDGDTADIQITNGAEERTRFILINTPESKGKFEDNPEPYAIEAYEFTKELLEGRTVWLEIDKEERDQYDRLLAYIWLDNVVVNREVVNSEEQVIIGEKIGKITLNEILLRDGLAEIAVYPPNTKYQEQFEAAQEQAKEDKKGMWSK